MAMDDHSNNPASHAASPRAEESVDAIAAATDSYDLREFKNARGEAGLSLEQLSGAFAEMFSSGLDPYQPAPETTDEALAAQAGLFVPDNATRPGPGDDACEVSPRSIIEAMLFVGRPDSAPLGSAAIAALMRGVRASEVDDWVADINRQYQAENRPYQIVSHGGGYRLELCPECAAWVDAFHGKVRQARLSQAAIDVLAIVAYNQPITLEEIQNLRGHACGSVISQLVRRRLLSVQRTGDSPRITQFRTTDRFNQVFGLKSLDDLPRSQDVNLR